MWASVQMGFPMDGSPLLPAEQAGVHQLGSLYYVLGNNERRNSSMSIYEKLYITYVIYFLLGCLMTAIDEDTDSWLGVLGVLMAIAMVLSAVVTGTIHLWVAM